ncbi:hypothetical protein OTU49_012619, partial [Cherax quadricarinatus]
GVEYTIPPLWKRLIAEVIDFLLLFAIKLAVTFAAVDAFDLLSDIEKYDFENLGADIMSDYKMALDMTSEILVLELIHRIGTCVFEVGSCSCPVSSEELLAHVPLSYLLHAVFLPT